MKRPKIFSLIGKSLGALGLSPEATDDIIDRISDFLSDKWETKEGAPAYPYVLSRDFLTPAGHNFFSVLKTTVVDQPLISVKVGLGDLFEQVQSLRLPDSERGRWGAITHASSRWPRHGRDKGW